MKPRILLVNDDGIHAPGLAAAREVLEPLGELVVVVPDREMSGASHSLTLHQPLRIQAAGDRTYAINGTPTDCVSLALHRILPEKPALVFSGINRGTNVGYDVTYSGTVAGAYEGAIHGVPAIAVSMQASGDFSSRELRAITTRIVARVLAEGKPGTLLNVNFPAGEIRGVRVTVQGHGGFRSEIVEKVDPRGNHYYWIGGQHAHDHETRVESDLVALRSGWASVTPLTLDLTDRAAYDALRQVWQDGEPGETK